MRHRFSLALEVYIARLANASAPTKYMYTAMVWVSENNPPNITLLE